MIQIGQGIKDSAIKLNQCRVRFNDYDDANATLILNRDLEAILSRNHSALFSHASSFFLDILDFDWLLSLALTICEAAIAQQNRFCDGYHA